MPNQRAAGLHKAQVWVPLELWELAGEVAKGQGLDRGKVLSAFLRWYVGEEEAELPTPARRARRGTCGTA
jgi:hypothetical protein